MCPIDTHTHTPGGIQREGVLCRFLGTVKEGVWAAPLGWICFCKSEANCSVYSASSPRCEDSCSTSSANLRSSSMEGLPSTSIETIYSGHIGCQDKAFYLEGFTGFGTFKRSDIDLIQHRWGFAYSPAALGFSVASRAAMRSRTI